MPATSQKSVILLLWLDLIKVLTPWEKWTHKTVKLMLYFQNTGNTLALALPPLRVTAIFPVIPLSWVFKDTRIFALLKMAREAIGTKGIHYRSGQSKYLQESRDTGVNFARAVLPQWHSRVTQSQVLGASEWVQSSRWWNSALSYQDGSQPGLCFKNMTIFLHGPQVTWFWWTL